jgi:membrane protease YdiL (CAAX protease family)
MTLIEPVVLSPGAAPFKLQLSPDKILAGLIVAATVWDRYIRSSQELSAAIRQATPLIFINVMIVIALSIGIGYLNFAPKFTPLFFIWAAHNLLFTCIGEEIFFRGFIQHQLATSFAEMRNGQWLALAISSILFGLVHFGGGTSYVLLAVVAGFGYGYVFMRTQRIEMSVLAHFIMNATHFLLFAYPRLQ